MISFDECQQLDAENVFYALSRLRSTAVNYQLRAVATCNPEPSSFLMDFVRHSLDDNLIPIRREEYPVRYFYRSASGIIWYDTKEEAEKVHGIGAESGVKSFLFVPGSIFDNPVGLEQNRDYISTLKALPKTESDRLLKGAWVVEQRSGFWNRSHVKFLDFSPFGEKKYARCWDLAFSEPSEARPKVDASAGVLMSKDKQSVYTVEDCVVLRKKVFDVEKAIFETAERDGRNVQIGLPLDPGATAGAYCKDLARRLSERGFSVRLIRPEKGKLQRFLPFASASEAGFVRVVRSHWTEYYVNELEQTEFSSRTSDDCADATSDCFWLLNQGVTLPTFTLPDFSSQSAIQTSSAIPTSGLSLPSSGLTIPTY